MQEQDIKLLYKYLKQIFPNTAKQIMQDNIDHLFDFHGLSWSVGKRSLEYFCLYFLGDVFVPNDENGAAPIAPIHRLIWKDIQESIIGDGADQIGRILPRGTGKSVFGNYAPSIWAHCYKFKNYTLICSDTGLASEKFIKEVKSAFLNNKLLEKGFGKLLNDKDKHYICNATQLEFTNHTSIEAISSSSSIRGRKYNNIRPDLIILDDYQSIDDVRTEEAREKKWNRYSNDVKFASQKPIYRQGKLFKKGTTFIALGTLQHKECFYSRLLKQPTWKFQKNKGILLEDIDTYFNTGLWLEFKNLLFDFKNDCHLEDANEFYYQHIKEMKFPLLWAEFWDCLDIATQYFENPNSFKQEFQGNVDSIGIKYFKTIRTMSADEIEEHTFDKTMLVADPASSISVKADSTALIVGSTSSNDLTYIRKAILVKLDFDSYCAKVVELLKIYTDITHISIEKNLYMGADVLKIKELISKEVTLDSRFFTFINKMQKVNKDEKISTIISAVNLGQIIFNEDDTEAINQMMDFAGQKFSVHDDMPDVVSQLTIDIKEIEITYFATFLDKKLLF